MLDADTRRRIDTARDILVGKVPDPKSQVEQITIALIYKFMDDIDAEAEELGGRRRFFAGDFARYGWPRLVRAGLGGHEVLNLYAEAITRVPDNPGIPALFRDIFNNAYLPYRDPETLRAFLKVIDTFSYDHSERLGDAFEYLLSVLGSQGDAGQFRTPRHIIDFIVAILDPKKDETILDPACGTAGFLVSSYKHILQANTDAEGHSTLTPDEKGKLAANFKGYDISPDMVRLSLVNLYLHGFVEPHIAEYDTLTSEERWNEYADVILANPPFMSPKGGIRPHRRFSVQSKRSEVLFVDYMAEHLTPSGRAGIIVPEGIIFQSQTAHKQLRKMLVENYLVAVISLPAGVFQPYSGVKTSILILDKALAQKTNRIAFFKVDNDGFDLGAQRRPIVDNDLPQVAQAVMEYLNLDATVHTRDRQHQEETSCSPCSPLLQHFMAQGAVLVADKGRIAADGEYNLSGERYREKDPVSDWPMVALGQIAQDIKAGFACGKGAVGTEGVPHIRPMNITETGQFTWRGLKRINDEDYEGREGYALEPGDILFNNTNSKELVGKTCHINQPVKGGFSNHITRIRVDRRRCVSQFVACALHGAWQKGEFLRRANKWIGQAGINTKSLSEFQFPLPPLEVQREIVAEIEGYQQVIDAARAVVDNYRRQVAVDPEWPMAELREVCDLISGQHIDSSDYNTDGVGIGYLTGPADFGDMYVTVSKWTTLPKVLAQKNDILITVKGSGLGKVNMLNIEKVAISRQLMAIRVFGAMPKFLYGILSQMHKNIQNLGSGAAIPGITRDNVLTLKIPMPGLDVQRAVVAELEAEQALVLGNRELIERFEKKTKKAVARMWGESAENRGK